MTSRQFDELFAQITAVHEPSLTSLRSICSSCAEIMRADGSSILLTVGETIQGGVSASDRTIVAVEDVQLTVGEGPGIDAHTTQRPVLVEDLDRRLEQWPQFVRGVTALGLVAVFALPLQMGAIKLGVLSLYRSRVGPLDGREVEQVLVLADVITQVVLELHASVGREELGWSLSSAAEHRAVVHQATGMVSAQLECSIQDAFVRLRAFAYAKDIAVDQVAHSVVDRDLRFDGEIT